MEERPIEQLTLRQLFTEASRQSRDVINHLEQGFLPKVYSLVKLLPKNASDSQLSEIEDVTVYNSAQNVLQSEQFTHQQHQNLEKLLTAIDAAANQLVNEG